MITLFRRGRNRGLEVMDLYKTLNADLSKKLGDKLGKNWENEMAKAKDKDHPPSLFRAISKTFLFVYMLWGIFVCVQMVAVKSLQPVVMAYLIRLFSGPDSINHSTEIYISSTVMILMSVIQIFMLHHGNFGMSLIGMRIRIAVSSLVFRKITRLNQRSLGQTAAGHVVNLLSNDVTRFDLVIVVLHALWIMPIQVMLVSYFLWEEVGISCLAGILSMAIFSLPLQGYLGKVTGDLRYKIAQKTDTRVKLMSEIVSGIQVIKMYTWEKPFEKIIKFARATEIDDLTKTSYLRGFFASSMVFIERVTLFLTLICYVLLGNVITADKVFSMAQFYNILQLAMAILYPLAISYGAEAWVSIKRLQEFLLLEEMEKSTCLKIPECGVQMRTVFAAWSPTTQTLNNISIQIRPGTLCAVVGPVGAGKSSLLQLLLGELPFTAGTVAVGGKISYAAQEPWLFAGTVRNNILFGQRFSKSKYDQIVKVCSLEKDFEQFPYGDKTVVGERGVSLSGGQRARINLARAIYRDADIYLLDDPLSAVDTHVGKHLFDKCIYKYLKGKTRILVTHQLQYLKKANLIVVINEGRIEAQGTFQELSSSELDFTKILVEADESQDTEETKELETSFHRRTSTISLANSAISENIESMQRNEANKEQTSSDPNINPLNEYFKSTKSMCLIAILTLIFISAQSACAGADYWVAYWTQQENIRHSNYSHINSSRMNTSQFETFEVDTIKQNNPSHYTYTVDVPEVREPKMHPFNDWYDNVEVGNTIYSILKTEVSMYIYGSLIVAAILLTVGRSLLYYKICMLASKNLHAKMFHALLKAPMRFFDTNPSGRVLNRFSKDMGAIDDILPRVLLDALQVMLVMAGILVNVGIANRYIIIPMFLLGILFWYMRNVYISTAKDIKHIEGVTKSPVFSHVTSTLHGLTTIRAARVENIIINEFDHHQDVHTSAWFLTVTCFVSFGLWLDIICVIFIACVTFSFVILNQYDSVDGSMAGLAISQSLILTGMLQHGMRQTSEVVNQLTSVERVLQYTTIEDEKSFETPKDKVPVHPWPSNGFLEFRNLSLKYVKDEPSVLNNLNIVICPGEKIGIVGRTGAGKSSLIAALFRLAPLEGSIVIDGIDTKDLGLTDLRRKISIIPQEPVLFSATMRYNLDPFGEFEDSKLWAALDEVELKDAFSSLDYKVSEGGSNFSLGQRQLICLARAILRNNKILVLDEATANVDPRTDSFIQVTIRKKFRRCTVLTIAHRLNTIMDSDKVLVMSFGNMVEFDHPHKLLQIPDGYFHKMVEETGHVMSMQLKEVARNAYSEIDS